MSDVSRKCNSTLYAQNNEGVKEQRAPKALLEMDMDGWVTTRAELGLPRASDAKVLLLYPLLQLVQKLSKTQQFHSLC